MAITDVCGYWFTGFYYGKNGHRSDNRLHNLQLLTNADHSRLHYSAQHTDERGRFLGLIKRIRKVF